MKVNTIRTLFEYSSRVRGKTPGKKKHSIFNKKKQTIL